MNNTNRGLNRLLIFIVGLLLVAGGGIAILLAALPTVTNQWRSSASRLTREAPPWVAAPTIGTASLLVICVALVSLILILLLVAFIAKQGRGRSAAALQQHTGATSTRIDLTIPRALLEEHLKQRDELVGLRISAYEVRSTPMLKITARCRRGVSPATVSALIGRAITDLEQIIGTDVPAFVQLTGGFRVGNPSRPQVT